MKKKLQSLGYIVVGQVLLSFAISTLVLQHNMVAGGVTGFALVIQSISGMEITSIVSIANCVLFLAGLLYMGKRFALTTLVSSLLFPMLLGFFESQTYLHHYCDNTLLAAILAGCLIGMGIGFILKGDASTGGVDILAIMVHKKWQFPVFITLNVIDLCLLSLQITTSDVPSVLYGLIVIFLTSFMLNKTLNFGKPLVLAKA